MNDNLIRIIGKSVQGLFVIGGLILCAILIVKGDDIIGGDAAAQGYVDITYYLTYVVAILCIGVILVAGLFFLATRFKKNIGFLIGLAAFAIIIGLAYALGNGDTAPYENIKNVELTTSISKWIDAGIYTFYILVFVAAALILGGWLRKIIFLR